MAIHQEVQSQRYELKFIVPETLRPQVRAFISSYLELDAYARDDYSYPIHSVYLDSPRLHTYHSSVNGERNRYKLRIRYYDDDPHSPVFLETKRKICDVVHKQRCMVGKSILRDALAGDTSRLREEALRDHHAFTYLMHQTNATPRAIVSYIREAWVSPQDNSVRVTMDREVTVEPRFDLKLRTSMDKPVTVFPRQIVLELKFTNRFPGWFREIVETFNLMQCGAAKYAGGIMLYGENGFLRAPELQYA